MLRCVQMRRCAARSVGYGPFAAEAKARQRRQAQQTQEAEEPPTRGAAIDASPDAMQHMHVETNMNLRLSLAGLPHPSSMRESIPYQSPEWRRGIAQLYRTILRLHNKPVAVSLDVSRSRTGGPTAAVSRATGVSEAEARFLGTAPSSSSSTPCQADADPSSAPEQGEYMLRYLLTPDQRIFGNRFVHEEFQRHRDADAITAGIFYEGWYQYVLQLASGVTSRELTEEERRLLNPEQMEKLNELRGSLFSMRAEKEPGFLL